MKKRPVKKRPTGGTAKGAAESSARATTPKTEAKEKGRARAPRKRPVGESPKNAPGPSPVVDVGEVGHAPDADGGWRRLVPLSIGQFRELARQVELTRKIHAIHLHASVRPCHREDRGRETVESIARFHVQCLGLRQIAQHITVDRQGVIWTGRHWGLPPVSVAGHNGNDQAGPMMVTVVGDFREDGDEWKEPQNCAVAGVVATLRQRFGLQDSQISFAAELTGRGRGGFGPVSRARFLEEVDKWKQDHEGAFGDEYPTDLPLGISALDRGLLQVALEELRPSVDKGRDACDAIDVLEFSHEQLVLLTGQVPAASSAGYEPVEVLPVAARGGGGIDLRDPARIEELRPHVINLSAGMFSSGGAFETNAQDVAAIFGEHIPAWAARHAGNGPLRIVLYAHGGLVPEEEGLDTAWKHLRWWKHNGVYPVSFVWETGLLESLMQLIRGETREFAPQIAGARNFLTDASDRVIESLARRLGPRMLWEGMKRSAERAFEPGGAGRVCIEQLQRFCAGFAGDVELHAVGHSAGSIFLAHALEYALRQGLKLKTLHFLAPAITNELFRQKLSGHIGRGKGVEHLTLFTMNRSFELDDTVGPYRKSLLYLIYYALEPSRETPVLGLQESLRRDRILSDLFGLNTVGPADAADVVWSKTAQRVGPHASQSVAHGAFDDDPATLNSIVLRIRRETDPNSIFSYPAPRAFAAPSQAAGGLPAPDGAMKQAYEPPGGIDRQTALPPAGASGLEKPLRLALCIGINEYPEARLDGCVADSKAWKGWLQRQGFSVEWLTDAGATRAAILANMQRLILGAAPGAVIVIQYAGHGTLVPDLDGDELRGNTPGSDQALVPVDHRQNGYVIDDDIAGVCDGIRSDVNVTFLFDCCHSGTATRFLFGHAAHPTAGAKKRFLPADAEMVQAHRRSRVSHGFSRNAVSRDVGTKREILFSACRSDQVAWESNGQGDFTRAALSVLDGTVAGMTCAEAHRRIVQALAANRRQDPELHCEDSLRESLFLSPRPQTGAGAPVASATEYETALRELPSVLGRANALLDVIERGP